MHYAQELQHKHNESLHSTLAAGASTTSKEPASCHTHQQNQPRPTHLEIPTAQPDVQLPDGSCNKARLADLQLCFLSLHTQLAEQTDSGLA
jgi:hypothetical protein